MVGVTGIIGVVLLPVAWLLERHRLYENGYLDTVSPRLVALFAAGAGLLAVHAVQRQDPVLLVAMLAIAVTAATELVLLYLVQDQ